MSNKAARNLFVFGSLFFFAILVILTFDTLGKVDKRAPEITAAVNAGKMVWHKYDCIGCHTILGNGSYFAPDMTKVVERKPKEYLKRFLMEPKAVNPMATMPKLGLTAEEAENLLTFLDWISKVDTNDWPPKPILAVTTKAETPGQVVYLKYDCASCHSIRGIGGTTAPDLTKVGPKYDAAWHMAHFRDPQSVVKNSVMPSFGHLSEQELKDLTDYMLTLK